VAFQSLYRRYRPGRFAEVRGQDHVVRTLRNAVANGTVSHAYLFSGPRGTGKTSTARILAKALNCEAPLDGEPCGTCQACLAVESGSSLDVSELDAASNNGVDAMRELVARVALAGAGRTRVYILDEVHMLSAGASNALLKTLEDPPEHVVFVLATTDPQKVLSTIASRTQSLEFHLLPAATLAEHLRWVAHDAGLDVGDDVVEVAVRRGQGSARDALSALDQIVAAGGVQDDHRAIDEMVEALCERDTGRALSAVAGACAAGRDPRTLAEALLAHLRDAFLSTLAVEVVSLPDQALEVVADHGRRLGPAACVRALDALGEALVTMRDAPDARIVLEVALVRVTRPETDPSPGALLERIERLERAAGDAAAPGRAASIALGDSGPPPGAAPAPVPAGSAREAARQAVHSRVVAPKGPPAAGPPRAPGVPRPALGGVRQNQQAAPQPAMAGTGAPTPGQPMSAPPVPVAAGEAVQAETAPGRPMPSREELTLAWADHVLAKLRPIAKGLFGAGRFAAVDDRGAVFAVPTGAMRGKCEARRADVEAALASFFGRPVPLRVIVDPSPAAQLADGGAPGASLAEPVDLDELQDAPPEPDRGLDRLTEAFPGAEVVEAGGDS
jgi:DNA polymerase-3 subunit gamma/tau